VQEVAGQSRRHAARRQLIEPLHETADAKREARQQREGDLRARRNRGVQRLTLEYRAARRLRSDRCPGKNAAREQRHVAERSARPFRVYDDIARAVAAKHAHLTLEHDDQSPGRIARTKERFACGERSLDAITRKRLERVAPESAKERQASDERQIEHVPRVCRNFGSISHSASVV
jgi:hypothetical protein